MENARMAMLPYPMILSVGAYVMKVLAARKQRYVKNGMENARMIMLP
ncbi:expressed unknown protein [Ectocarpus siliculosus]|uniref:Uncharacterized protein n=1 Tax=Ectocarpus siliculosus TaxID=2880 RepID=D7FXC5_ECTSI|nr:expressed unknown protein [Ectocarpus siliculosus]|eukprot:CBJ32262.1 expressed unknown protein [Ectocarpus siliculosus]